MAAGPTGRRGPGQPTARHSMCKMLCPSTRTRLMAKKHAQKKQTETEKHLNDSSQNITKQIVIKPNPNPEQIPNGAQNEFMSMNPPHGLYPLLSTAISSGMRAL